MAWLRKDVAEGDWYRNFPAFGWGKIDTHPTVREWFLCFKWNRRVRGIVFHNSGGGWRTRKLGGFIW